MSKKSYQWDAVDNAACAILGDMLDATGMSIRAAADRISVDITHTRISDIKNGNKNPVRLSEMIAICDLCKKDPVETLRRIIARANEIEAAEAQQSAVEDIIEQLQAGASTADLGLAASANHGLGIDAIAGMSDQEKVQWIAYHADDYEAVAKDIDWQAEQEHYEDLP